MTYLNAEGTGIAIYYLSTGLCVGGITEQGSVEDFENDDTILEAMPLSEIEKISYCELPSRCIERGGRVIGSYLEEPILEFLLMTSGDRYEFVGTLPQPLDLTQLRPGQIMLLPGLIYSQL